MDSNSDLINFSRAGDIFHYRWAVKRCLKLLDFNIDLTHITIEGSQEARLAGEAVVDLAEYRESESGEKSVEYFQLKHSTVQIDKNFTLSLLKDTVVGLSQRFSELTKNPHGFKSVTFTIVTNRLISPNFKRNLEKIANGVEATEKFTKTIQDYTKLKGVKLKRFCKCLKLCDSEGDYDGQKYDIHKELSRLTVSKDISDREKLLVSKVWEKIEPGKSNVLKKEDILEVFNVTDINDFFPAPPLFESISEYIPREEQTSIVTSIKSAATHTIIIANGGVGKSILSCNLSSEFIEPSVVIAYDCFGNGSYRRPSAKRHGAKHALTQVINSLAKDGLCDQIIPARNEPDEYWIKIFLNRVDEVCAILSSKDESAFLVIIFDAVDNAEMAAEEFGESCFAKQLLKESVPSNCRLVFTCRPERLHLLDHPGKIKPIQLSSFSNEETLTNLQQKYPNASLEQAIEFNRLTSGNPRVQSNALALKVVSLNELLLSFGTTPISVEDLIERQLEESIIRIKDGFPQNYRKSIENICTGLAILPPFIPLEILAKVANVSKDSVRSFVADLGLPLWLIDDAVQFRDEPTEKWFQDNYSAAPGQISTYVDAIKHLDDKLPYVAEALPILLLKAERFDELVEIALSDSYLPSISSFDDKQVKIYRLQYAFKAALKESRLYEAVKLALRAGEEIAGNDRQIDILSNNLDLAAQFLSPGRIQELAHKKMLQGKWEGSELVYSASLLSSLPSLKGEAKSYYRSANYWLRRYFQKRDEAKGEEERFNEKLENSEIVELATTEYRLNGWRRCVDFLLSWSPGECLFRVASAFFERLIDAGEFDKIDLMSDYGKCNPSFILAVTSELMKVGKTPPRQCLIRCLNQIIKPNLKLDKPSDSFHEVGYSLNAYLSLFEACLIHKAPLQNIKRGVNYFYDFPMLYKIVDEHQYYGAREALLRYLSIQAVVKSNYELNFKDYIPDSWQDKNDSYENSKKLERAKELVGKLLPWYMVKAKLLAGLDINLVEENEDAQKLSLKIGSSSYREYEPTPYEITKVRFQNILFFNSDCSDVIDSFICEYRENKLKASYVNNLYYLRASCRNKKLQELSEVIEASCVTAINVFDIEESPESYSESYINLARAVLSIGREDARSYFDEALTKASNFGEEAVLRWEALTALAKRSAEDGEHNPELAHRYMRCAEMIGDSVAREKYWDRNDAIATCFQLSPESAFAISNRWKDRGVGWHDRQINPLAHSAIDSKSASPSSLWSLSAFSWEFGLIAFCEKCISQELSKKNQQRMLDHLISDLRVKGVVGKKWLKISELAKKYSLQNKELKNLKQLSSDFKKENSTSSPHQLKNNIEQGDESLWDDVYGQFDILMPNGFREAYKVYDSRRGLSEPDRFWLGCYLKVTSRSLISFLKVISETDLLDIYDIRSAFEKIPDEWKSKLSSAKAWNNIITYVASRFPSQFTAIYERRYLLENFIFNDDTDKAIQDGVVKGLSSSVDIESARALFSFAHYSSSKLSIAQAKDLIDFGLSRFEDFIEDDYADGTWNTNSQIPQGLAHALSCYIYANLGSPDAEERWRAVHAVIQLYNLHCQIEVNLLLDCFSSGPLQAYIPTKYTFYDLHAKLYLLMALARCAYENPDLLLENKDVFSEIALNNKQGILFQYYAKQICIEIERYKSGSFDNSIVEKIQRSCSSRLPLLNENMYRYRTDSPWHMGNSLEALPEVWFAHDFDQYWFEPLGRVFGIPSSQVNDLAKDVLSNQWGIEFESSHMPDSRTELWKNRRDSYDAYSSGSSYSKVDGYSFYISYHLMLEVASKLLETMQVIQNDDEEFSSWDNWLKRHLILNNDRMLLSELRDPMPIERRDWVHSDYSEEWRWQIIGTDFIDQLIVKSDSKTWLNVEGGWHEYKDGRKERISYSSILVPIELSQSLLHTTVNFDGHLNEVYLNRFCDSNYSSRSNHKFCGKEWLSQGGDNNDIESNDPFVGEIYAQPFKLSGDITEVIEVAYSEEQKKCILLTDNSICLQNKYWSEDRPNDSETYIRTGSQALASLDFLKLICKKMNADIAIQVNIERSFSTSHRHRKNDDELAHIPRYSKTFILSEDGKLRDTRKSYQLR